MFRGLAAIVLVGACAAVSNGTAPDPSSLLDEKVFRCNVEPILVRQCSYNACHGIAGAALRVYSPGKLRATMPTTIDEAIAELTDAEHHTNFTSAAGFSFGITAVDDNWLLRKPLDPREGGYEHFGGAVFSGGGDPQYGAIRTWLLGKGVCP